MRPIRSRRTKRQPPGLIRPHITALDSSQMVTRSKRRLKRSRVMRSLVNYFRKGDKLET